MDIFEYLREQNSGYPLQGVVLEGLGRADAVVDAVPLMRALEVGSPAMAVTSSVVVEEDREDEAVVVAFCAPDTTVAGTIPDRDAMFVRILGRREVEASEEICAEEHCASKRKCKRKEDIRGTIGAILAMCNEGQACHAPCTLEWLWYKGPARCREPNPQVF
jgi:hypothetical protein